MRSEKLIHCRARKKKKSIFTLSVNPNVAFLSGREADVSGVHTSNPSLLVWSLLRVFSSLAQFVSVLVEATV